VSTKSAAVTAATRVEKLPAPTATSTIVPTVVSSVAISMVSSESLEHADNVSAAIKATVTIAPPRKTFIPISFGWVSYRVNPMFGQKGQQLEFIWALSVRTQKRRSICPMFAVWSRKIQSSGLPLSKLHEQHNMSNTT
jgi:hypothetical protein